EPLPVLIELERLELHFNVGYRLREQVDHRSPGGVVGLSAPDREADGTLRGLRVLSGHVWGGQRRSWLRAGAHLTQCRRRAERTGELHRVAPRYGVPWFAV